MQRITGITPERAGFFLRLIYRAARTATAKLTGKDVVPEPLTVTAYQPWLVWGVSQMEASQAGMKGLPLPLKVLASITASRNAGCRF